MRKDKGLHYILKLVAKASLFAALAFSIGGLAGLIWQLPFLFLLYIGANDIIATFNNESSLHKKLSRVVFCLAGVGVLALLAFYFLMLSVPQALNWDEGFYLNAAKGFELFGTLYVRMWGFPEPTSLISGGGPGYASLFPLLLLKYFSVSLFNARLFSYCFAIISLILCYLLCRQTERRSIALLTTAIYCVSMAFFYFINARLDSYSICAIFLLIIFFNLVKSSSNLSLHFALGLAAVLSMEFHVNAAACGFAIGCWYLFGLAKCDWDNLKTALKPLLFFGLGAGIASGLYLYFHVVKDGQAFLVTTQHCHYCYDSIFEREAKRIVDLVTGYPFISILVLIVLLCSFQASEPLEALQMKKLTGRPASILRQNKQVREQLFLFAAAYVFCASVIPPHYEFYLIPIFMPLLASFVRETANRSDKKAIINPAFLIVLVVCMYLRAFNLTWASINHKGDTHLRESYAACIKELLPPSTPLIAPAPLYIQMPEHYNFLTVVSFTEQAAKLRGKSLIQFIEEHDPQAVMLLSFEPAEYNMVVEEYLENNSEKFTKFRQGLYFRKQLMPNSIYSCERLEKINQETHKEIRQDKNFRQD